MKSQCAAALVVFAAWNAAAATTTTLVPQLAKHAPAIQSLRFDLAKWTAGAGVEKLANAKTLSAAIGSGGRRPGATRPADSDAWQRMQAIA